MKAGYTHRDDEILRCEVGSGLHGIAIEGTDDHDEMGIFVESPEVVMGLAPATDHRVWRTQPEGVRSGPGDVDLVQYSVRKYMRLAVQGNPTIILPLYAPPEKILYADEWGHELRLLRDAIVSRQAGKRFLGYMNSQVERMEGRKKMPTTRAELIATFGYDTKFASHALRLGLQGVELLTTGTISLPIRESDLGTVRAVKQGEWTKEEVMHAVVELRERLQQLVDEPRLSVLPPKPDLFRINSWMIGVHRGRWWW